jgi:DNA topoisomerase-1
LISKSINLKKSSTLFQKNRAMAKNLVIESPAKAKTIEKFLGSDYQVELWAYRRLAFKRNGVDVENGFKPKYEVSADKSIGY